MNINKLKIYVFINVYYNNLLWNRLYSCFKVYYEYFQELATMLGT